LFTFCLGLETTATAAAAIEADTTEEHADTAEDEEEALLADPLHLKTDGDDANALERLQLRVRFHSVLLVLCSDLVCIRWQIANSVHCGRLPNGEVLLVVIDDFGVLLQRHRSDMLKILSTNDNSESCATCSLSPMVCVFRIER